MNKDWIQLTKGNIPTDLLSDKYEVEFFSNEINRYKQSDIPISTIKCNIQNEVFLYRYRLKESPIKKKIIRSIKWGKHFTTIGNCTESTFSRAILNAPCVRHGHIMDEHVVSSIEEHSCGAEGDKWYWDIHFENNSTLRIFNPEEVLYVDEEKIDE